MERYVQAMEKCALFAGIGAEELERMLRCLGARKIDAQKNERIFSQGDPAEYVGVVLSGSVQVVREDYYGRRSVVTAVGPGELFGEAFACAGVLQMPVSAAAAEKSEILLIGCRRILKACPQACAFHGKLIENLLRVTAQKNLALSRKLRFLSCRTTREKIMAYLLAMAEETGSSEFTIPYDRQALADYLEVDRSALSAEIGKLRRQGVIDTRRSWFKVFSDSF